MNLQRNLTEIETQISAARRAYNQAVTDYNNAKEMFLQFMKMIARM
jgi:LemA protein